MKKSTNNNMFKIGDLVVCIDAKRRWYKLGGLQENEMYTVTGFNPYDGGLILKEVKSPSSGYNAFAANRFRKVDYAYATAVIKEMESQQELVAQTENRIGILIVQNEEYGEK